MFIGIGILDSVTQRPTLAGRTIDHTHGGTKTFSQNRSLQKDVGTIFVMFTWKHFEW